MHTLQSLLQSVKQENEIERSIERSFLKEFDVALYNNRSKQPYPKETYRPSSLWGCEREIFFKQQEVAEDKVQLTNEFAIRSIDILDNGTDRHERIQRTIQKMPNVKQLDVKELILMANQVGIRSEYVSTSDDGLETRGTNYDLKVYFQADGAIHYDNRDMLVEIKTMTPNKFDTLYYPMEMHLLQANIYAYCLNLPFILFIYEERSFLRKKVFLVPKEEKYITQVREKVARLDYYREHELVPPADTTKCIYCKHKQTCETYEPNGLMKFVKNVSN